MLHQQVSTRHRLHHELYVICHFCREASVVRHASVSRASSVLPDLEVEEEEVQETVTKKPVRNR